MEMLFDILSWICLVLGSVFVVTGGIGIVRLPDFYTRLHAGGMTDTLGAGLVIVGLVLQAAKVGIARILESGFEFGPWLVAIKLLMILFFLWISSPTSCHALAQAAITHGVRPREGDENTGVEGAAK